MSIRSFYALVLVALGLAFGSAASATSFWGVPGYIDLTGAIDSARSIGIRNDGAAGNTLVIVGVQGQNGQFVQGQPTTARVLEISQTTGVVTTTDVGLDVWGSNFQAVSPNGEYAVGVFGGNTTSLVRGRIYSTRDLGTPLQEVQSPEIEPGLGTVLDTISNTGLAGGAAAGVAPFSVRLGENAEYLPGIGAGATLDVTPSGNILLGAQSEPDFGIPQAAVWAYDGSAWSLSLLDAPQYAESYAYSVCPDGSCFGGEIDAIPTLWDAAGHVTQQFTYNGNSFYGQVKGITAGRAWVNGFDGVLYICGTLSGTCEVATDVFAAEGIILPHAPAGIVDVISFGGVDIPLMVGSLFVGGLTNPLLAVPEPGTGMLLAAGLLGLAWKGRRMT